MAGKLLELVNSFPDYAKFKKNLDWINSRPGQTHKY